MRYNFEILNLAFEIVLIHISWYFIRNEKENYIWNGIHSPISVTASPICCSIDANFCLLPDSRKRFTHTHARARINRGEKHSIVIARTRNLYDTRFKITLSLRQECGKCTNDLRIVAKNVAVRNIFHSRFNIRDAIIILRRSTDNHCHVNKRKRLRVTSDMIFHSFNISFIDITIAFAFDKLNERIWKYASIKSVYFQELTRPTERERETRNINTFLKGRVERGSNVTFDM